jgi:flavorubredoxin
MTSVVEIVPEQLYALSFPVTLDGRVSWVPPGSIGWQPSNLYVVVEADKALVVDVGLPVHRNEILSALEPLLRHKKWLGICPTRVTEFESARNVRDLLDAFPFNTIYTPLGANPLLYFRASATGVPDPGVEQRVAGQRIDLGSRRSIRVQSPALRSLPTSWLYDEKTKALFTSDIFTHCLLSHVDQGVVADKSHDLPSPSTLRKHLIAKLDWVTELEPVDATPLVKSINEIFEAGPVEVIAPTHGRIIKGERLVDMTRRALVDSLQRAKNLD